MFVTLGWAAPESDIAVYAQQNRLALVTRDFDFADIRDYPPSRYAGLLVLELPDDAVATFVLRVVESFIGNGRADCLLVRDVGIDWVCYLNGVRSLGIVNPESSHEFRS